MSGLTKSVQGAGKPTRAAREVWQETEVTFEIVAEGGGLLTWVRDGGLYLTPYERVILRQIKALTVQNKTQRKYILGNSLMTLGSRRVVVLKIILI